METNKRKFTEFVSCNKMQLFILLIFLGFNHGFSQNSRSYFYENEFDLSLPVKNNWSMDIGLGNRGMLRESSEDGKTSGYMHEHLELNHFTNYKLGEPLVLSLGLRYRFRELFNSSETNEFRIIQQVEYEPSSSSIQLSHRLRLEQRFREHTIHRVRYELEFDQPINDVFSLGAGTEALYAVSTHLKPEVEQRFSLSLENTSFKDLELGLSFEYRMENYVRNLSNEFFIITGVSYAL